MEGRMDGGRGKGEEECRWTNDAWVNEWRMGFRRTQCHLLNNAGEDHRRQETLWRQSIVTANAKEMGQMARLVVMNKVKAGQVRRRADACS